MSGTATTAVGYRLWPLIAIMILTVSSRSANAAPWFSCFDDSAPNVPAKIEDRDMYCDKDGLLVQVDMKPNQAGGLTDKGAEANGGDTAQREGWYWFGVVLRQLIHKRNPSAMALWPEHRRLTFEQVLDKLEPHHDGVFVRSPSWVPPGYQHPAAANDLEWGTSRDQLVPLIAAMGLWDKSDQSARLRRLWNALPDDILGKHSFNGEYRTGIPDIKVGPHLPVKLKTPIKGMDCLALKNASCDVNLDKLCAPPNCTDVKAKLPPCPGVIVPSGACPLPPGPDNCPQVCLFGHCVDVVLGCSQLKQSRHAIQDACIAQVEAPQQAARKLCETTRPIDQLHADIAARTTCETNRPGVVAGCLSTQAGNKATCEGLKIVGYQSCIKSNYLSNEPMGPATTNMYRRALGHHPSVPDSSELSSIVPPPLPGEAGELELATDSKVIVAKALAMGTDEVDEDLNHIVTLLMSRERFPTSESLAAVFEYVKLRRYTWGSYFDEFYKHYGNDLTDADGRLENGATLSHWQRTGSPIYGAVRWYHRPSQGANPQLAKLYEPLIDYYLHH